MVRRQEANAATVDTLPIMADQDHDDSDADQHGGHAVNVGLGAAFGAAVGTVIFAMTGEAFWIAVGPAFGVALAAVHAAVKEED